MMSELWLLETETGVYEPSFYLGGCGRQWPERGQCGGVKPPLSGPQTLVPGSHRGQSQANGCCLIIVHGLPASCFP